MPYEGDFWDFYIGKAKGHNHVKNSVVYPGTHDNTTLTAWWDESASAKEKAVAAAYPVSYTHLVNSTMIMPKP